ncbi:pyridoxamine 5'-phosphate oxidase family protein [Umezawaea endophytica]|uniref:Pyridoxamine 5'-phosphate oxidase family protein n=1 Tax=Umezawaea endophytica TaxID=1654476 RepID=A0A9X2VJG5_9PSEU|nr:pyridoxamine 5'-phosphate oxidase family protein [Umezawaea endophytica]MCS7477514.1 pyridoxamine 5'-phosphate oxidase family protein [Umezawaea endophytica]
MIRTAAETRKATDARAGVLTTVDAVGRLVSRPMARQAVGPDGDLWFVIERDSREVAHIAAVPEVSVTLTSEDASVSIFGIAAVVDDPTEACDLGTGWPEDPDVVLVRVTAMSADYPDAPDGGIVYLPDLATSEPDDDRSGGQA